MCGYPARRMCPVAVNWPPLVNMSYKPGKKITEIIIGKSTNDSPRMADCRGLPDKRSPMRLIFHFSLLPLLAIKEYMSPGLINGMETRKYIIRNIQQAIRNSMTIVCPGLIVRVEHRAAMSMPSHGIKAVPFSLAENFRIRLILILQLIPST